MSVQITLTWQEAGMAAWVGVRRRMSALRNNRREFFRWEPVKTPDLWGNDIEAAAAELVVCKWSNHYWNALHERPQELNGDAMGGLQVRHTAYKTGGLFIHKEDTDDDLFVLVTGAIPTFTLVGWLRAVDGKKEEWWHEDIARPSYLVPQEHLDEMESLAAIL